ncbi:hypothetical protein ACW95P_00560 [Candidatus Mycoplasma pogonae]
MLLKRYKIASTPMEFVKEIKLKTLIKSNVFKFAFWGLTTFSLFFGFFSSIMGTVKLASSRFPDHFSVITKLFVANVDGKDVDQWPIFVSWIGVATSILTGIIALFAMRKRWISNTKIYNNIVLEEKIYELNEGIYSDSKTRDMLFFKRIATITQTNTKIKARKKQQNAK